jgi:hypothetical protein
MSFADKFSDKGMMVLSAPGTTSKLCGLYMQDEHSFGAELVHSRPCEARTKVATIYILFQDFLMPQSTQSAVIEHRRIDNAIINFFTITTFVLAGICFYWYTVSSEAALLLLGWVTFGTAFDFLSHLVGNYLVRYPKFLETYARINFAALCFGIPFTAIAGSFVIAQIVPAGINAQILVGWQQILIASLLFGSSFLFAKYRQYDIDGAVEFTLDRSHFFTHVIWVARRVYLMIALLVGVAVMVESFGTDWALWGVAFGLSFMATVPLHIMRKRISSMMAEAVTLYILAFGSFEMFVG